MARIVFVTKAWRSGAAWVGQNIVQAIAEQGVAVSYIAPLADPPEREPRQQNITRAILPREFVDGVGGRTARAFASFKRIFFGVIEVVRARGWSRTFVFAIPEPLIITIPLFIILRCSGARVIFLVHDVVPHAWKFSGVLRSIEHHAHGLSYRIANNVVVMTEALKSSLFEKFGVGDGAVHVIPHGPFYIGNVPPILGNGVFLQFGTIRRNKRVLEVIRGVILARQEDPAIFLVIAGEPHWDDPEYWSECLSAIAQDVTGFMVKAGFLKDEELPALLAKVDALFLAYEDYDSQSGVGILAGLAGRPMIGTQSGGLADLLQMGLPCEVIASPVTPEGVANAILSFRRRPVHEWRAASLDGAEKLRATMSWGSVGQAYIDLFDLQSRRSTQTNR